MVYQSDGYKPKNHYFHLEMKNELGRPVRATVMADTEEEAMDYYNSHYSNLKFIKIQKLGGEKLTREGKV